MELNLSIAWKLGRETANPAPALLFSLLRGIKQEGSLSAAAKLSGVSYRTAWNLIKNWSIWLGGEIIKSQRGKGATLTPLGHKLLWAYDYTIEQTRDVLDFATRKIQAELDLVVDQTVDRQLIVSASHCLSHNILLHLIKTFAGEEPAISISGSSESLRMLQEGQCDVAGFHLAEGELSVEFAKEYRRIFDPSKCKFICSAKRRQGLIVKHGNPKNIRTLQDLVSSEVTMINRQPGSGTRLLFDAMLKIAGISAQSIAGYDHVEFTHSAVSAQVAGSSADTAVGTEASAFQFGLGFIPLAMETYYYAISIQHIENENIQRFISVIASKAWQQSVGKLEGYDTTDSGRVLHFEQVFHQST